MGTRTDPHKAAMAKETERDTNLGSIGEKRCPIEEVTVIGPAEELRDMVDAVMRPVEDMVTDADGDLVAVVTIQLVGATTMQVGDTRDGVKDSVRH